MSNVNNILLFFIFQGHNIRVVVHNGEPWFVAKDVCEALEINNASLAINGNPSRNETGLDEDEKGIYPVNTLGRPQATLCVNEPGLYRLIAKSHKPETKTFQRWVYHEVLPAIRKTGSYSLMQEEPQKRHQQSSQGVGWQASLMALSEDELIREIDYQRAMLAAVEAVYRYKYPQAHNNATMSMFGLATNAFAFHRYLLRGDRFIVSAAHDKLFHGDDKSIPAERLNPQRREEQ
jgi:prophage antirepressor-like protein